MRLRRRVDRAHHRPGAISAQGRERTIAERRADERWGANEGPRPEPPLEEPLIPRIIVALGLLPDDVVHGAVEPTPEELRATFRVVEE